MSTEVPVASDQFVALIGEFARSVGLQGEPDALGVEFVVGDHSVLIMPHPGEPERLVAEVSVGPLDEGPGAAEDRLRLLHLINEASRFEHDWLATLTQDDTILLYTIREIVRTDAGQLQVLLADGIERAEALMTILAGDAESAPAARAPQAASESAQDLVAPGFGGGFIRG